MATTKNRLNISLSPDIDKALDFLSKRDKTPKATKAGEMLKIALELEEDFYFSNIAKSRDTKDFKTLNHKQVWG